MTSLTVIDGLLHEHVYGDGPACRECGQVRDLVLAIDVGSERSGWVVLDERQRIIAHGLTGNETLRVSIHLASLLDAGWFSGIRSAVIEWTTPRGMPIKWQVLEMAYWVGRLTEALSVIEGMTVHRLDRLRVKLHICGSAAARDSNIIAALIDRYGGPGGKRAAVGLKSSPGPLYGVTRDVWQALALGLTYMERPEDAIW